MKCTKQPAFLEGKPTPITDVWEVRLPQPLWQRIRATAKAHRTTFSTITRLCVFELAERSSLRMRAAFTNMAKTNSTECKVGDLHRHMVCFYGEDVLLVRMAAMRLGITVSAFIRLALKLYLRHFAAEFHSKQPRVQITREMIFWRGIKRWISIAVTAVNEFSIPSVRNYTFLSFPPEERWGWPEAAQKRGGSRSMNTGFPNFLITKTRKTCILCLRYD